MPVVLPDPVSSSTLCQRRGKQTKLWLASPVCKAASMAFHSISTTTDHQGEPLPPRFDFKETWDAEAKRCCHFAHPGFQGYLLSCSVHYRQH